MVSFPSDRDDRIIRIRRIREKLKSAANAETLSPKPTEEPDYVPEKAFVTVVLMTRNGFSKRLAVLRAELPDIFEFPSSEPFSIAPKDPAKLFLCSTMKFRMRRWISKSEVEYVEV